MPKLVQGVSQYATEFANLRWDMWYSLRVRELLFWSDLL